ncbi:MAG: VWA domain-containing protein [Porphyromonadaceae bacterium]|nr:VWA domain-containing protein [Porphyromonadaceae bacterium]
MTFLHPYFLYLLLLIPALVLWYILHRRRAQATLLTPSLSFIKGVPSGWRVRLRHLPFALRMLALAMIIVALARPQSSRSWSESDVEGIDVMLTMDISTSMLAMDFEPNRIEAAKRVAADFVANRPNDNIGLVAFAGESFTVCPLTTDHGALINRLVQIAPGMIEDQTAIGLGLVTAVNRLRDSQAESKVIILLTDGVNNAGDISPQLATELAASLGITVHAIGMGTDRGQAPYPIPSAFGGTVVRPIPVDLDEVVLRQIAESTGGTYFRATDMSSLETIYKQIDQMEKTKLRTRNYQMIGEEYLIFAIIALLALALDFILRNTYLRTNP